MANAIEEVVLPFASTSASSSSNPSKKRERAPCDGYSKHTLVCIFSALCIFSAHASILLVMRLSLYSLVCIFSALCICSLSDLSFLAFLSLCPFFNRLTMANAFEEVVPPFASTSASSSNTGKERERAPYDVFINHRGPDSKHTLAASIYQTLKPMGFQVFLDQQELDLGDSIPSEIQDTMATSFLHIAILSPNYAESAWCLAELSYMLKTGNTIIPVFYNVDIAHIRWDKGIYTDAFVKHEAKGRYSSEKLQDWKNALQQVTYREGYNVKENESLMDPMESIEVQGSIVRKTTYTHILTILFAFVGIAKVLVAREGNQMGKRIRKGNSFCRDIIHSNEVDCHDQIRMSRAAFFSLARILRLKGSLRDTIHLKLEEQLVMFLHTLGHNLRNRKIAHNFGHSGETVSRYFHKVLMAILALHRDYFIPPGPGTPPEISGKDRFEPFFKDCIGAIDGTHIPVRVDVDIQGKYRDRKGNLSQNVMGVCSFDCKFQYCLASWEGSAADSHVLASALSRLDPLIVPPGKYYLMDAGYPSAPRFLAPYQCTRYHLKEWSRENPINFAHELFNHRHSSLRNAIECTFGILKQRFLILRHATSYDIMTQSYIVLACCILHNFITIEDGFPSEDDRDGIEVPLLETYGLSQEDRNEWAQF